MKQRLFLIFLLPALVLAGPFTALPTMAQQTAFAPFNVPVPEPRNLDMYVADRATAIQLGKALFWDMQLGSDGMTACATCHHHAGTDSRVRNTLHPGVDGQFEDGRANTELRIEDFPFVQFAEPDSELSARTVRRDDRVGTQGVNRTRLLGIVEGQAEEPGVHVRDNTFAHNARNVRQNTPRTAPTVINAVFNFANFLDGRAHPFFNGVDPFGPLNQNPDAVVYINEGGSLRAQSLVDDLSSDYALDNASLASQSVGPPLDTGEMSWIGRTWPDVGKKMLSLRPLAKQQVHPQDSALSDLRHSSGRGLDTTYGDLVRATFHPEFWNGPDPEGGYSHMEQNFSLFFGLAVQLYQATLIADRTPFDLWNLDPDNNPLPESAEAGRILFFDTLGCTACHVGPEMTGASVSFAREEGIIETMRMGNNEFGNYDIGFYNIGVTPTNDDLGRGGNAPPSITLENGERMPLAFSHHYFIGEAVLGFPPLGQPGCINDFQDEPPTICDEISVDTTRVAVDGAFKTPGLRNVELTGPYMHDGGMATLMQVVDFYARGGNFHQENLADLDPEMNPLGALQGPAGSPGAENRQALVDFMLALTDERVRFARAPFDHPELRIPDGHVDVVPGNPKRTRILADNTETIPAVGAAGRTEPLRPFLAPDDYDHQQNRAFHYLR
ncbi:Di-haem cytochrome c peroxidase [Geoalkalibacter ferrihydriticus]|uniref:Di-haem cytochrome c peroxidase n=1 Tax=Geoalkalibacter ferrihydriticus TaxID=392333 RepID=A0A1G9MXZ3_9BACT|nr:cytochrome c peroxidase [Geoalkalibacter ferrihydriticus]SDL78485.1 Di-haem cytochrome c peroxidase [Geoalkalibacter ferrihydriticus]